MIAPVVLKRNLSRLYQGDSERAHQFRYTLLLLDISTIVFLVVSTFFYDAKWVYVLDLFFGGYVVLDYLTRFWITSKRVEFVFNPLNVADLISVVSFLAPFFGGNLSFLRALRIVRLLRSYRLLSKLRDDFDFFRKNEDIILSATNLFIFIFVMTELVFVTQRETNPQVSHFIDALYFTVTALTTTGFGDITLKGDGGRALSIVIMICGVSLFLRLIQTVFRPAKVRFLCTDCGLYLHENDAVHCKHCGKVLPIPSDGSV